jgi:trehalose/maltose hydrolase-like predicted phosphorylase
VETFAFPSILIGAPETARAMLNYRSLRLDAARLNAALHGRGGIQFPWESSIVRGQEVTPPHGRLLGVEEHVNYSVALAFAGLYHATCDDQFLREQAWPVLRGVADWIATRVTETERGFEITDSLGLAEGRPAPVDNDAYVNMAAEVTLREAIDAAHRLGYRFPRWNHLADRLFIPRGPDGVIVNHDRFTASEGGEAGNAPEALAGFFPTAYRTDEATMRKTIEFYLGRVDGYIGAPMMSAPLGVFAAWIGDRARAAELFEQGYGAFINDPYRETNETSNLRMPDKPRSAPLFANLGGFLSSLYFGLPRLRMTSESLATWSEAPVAMPEGWDAIEVERIWLRGEAYRLDATHGRPARLLKDAA